MLANQVMWGMSAFNAPQCTLPAAPAGEPTDSSGLASGLKIGSDPDGRYRNI
jgi:hypothetical protein